VAGIDDVPAEGFVGALLDGGEKEVAAADGGDQITVAAACGEEGREGGKIR
jgi:hypothetical protein